MPRRTKAASWPSCVPCDSAHAIRALNLIAKLPISDQRLKVHRAIHAARPLSSRPDTVSLWCLASLFAPVRLAGSASPLPQGPPVTSLAEGSISSGACRPGQGGRSRQGRRCASCGHVIGIFLICQDQDNAARAIFHFHKTRAMGRSRAQGRPGVLSRLRYFAFLGHPAS
jgi:hypothetical protein